MTLFLLLTSIVSAKPITDEMRLHYCHDEPDVEWHQYTSADGALYVDTKPQHFKSWLHRVYIHSDNNSIQSWSFQTRRRAQARRIVRWLHKNYDNSISWTAAFPFSLQGRKNAPLVQYNRWDISDEKFVLQHNTVFTLNCHSTL